MAANSKPGFGDQTRIFYLPRQGKPAKKKETCVICFDDMDSDLMFYVVKCGHRFCRNCVKQHIEHIEVKLLDQKLPNCLHHRCNTNLSIDSCGELLTRKLSLMWEEMIRGSSIPYAERVYCPNENCSYVMSKTELSRSKSPRGDPSGLKRCVKCRGSFCVSCNVPWHYMRSCKDYINSCPNNDARLKSLANLCGWRQCPNCHHMVERSSGCNRITCRCGNAFCYKCGSGWNNHLLDCYARYDDVAIMGFLLLLLILVVLAPFLLAK